MFKTIIKKSSEVVQSTSKFLCVLTSCALLLTLGSNQLDAQDATAEPGRYRPQGREIASAIGREFGESLYEVRTYDPQADVEEFSSATIFYPLTLSFAPAFSAVVLVPGYTATQEAYDWWGPTLASLGIAVMIIDTNDPRDTFQPRVQAHIAAINFLVAENDNADSPIQGKIDTNKLGIMGHSLGGGAALAAAEQLGDRIKAVIPLMPYCCELGESFTGDYSGLTVPTLIITSAVDTVAPPEQHAHALYNAIADSTAKAYLEFNTGTHNLPTNGGNDLPNVARFTFAWLKLNLDGNTNFSAHFSGELSGDLAAKISILDTNQ
ncbi:MAG: hypothetical protein COA96_03425 [SAR86 cluster bacterium]|uniref:PET hydrolase/cutinase-like domain-containing protein n=1 Tax=SAR86 cluster bacterium TaxID=2030880 RepID=A0A2A5B8B6_9GAMM|nr:MAG: hypothetical protein COA96_03425 [SAR86 cluster bacterium]